MKGADAAGQSEISYRKNSERGLLGRMKEKKCSQVDERTERCRQSRSAGILQSANSVRYAHNNVLPFVS